ncbi:MAG: PIG-L family deacetylase [Chloroflexota bacterium]
MTEQLRPFYDHLYLSPHLDDAVLSCGGQIYQQTAAGESVLVVTVTAGDPPPTGPLSPIAQELHDRWNAGLAHPVARSAIIEQRRDEDSAACSIMGADYLHWPVMDCIYRADPATGAFLYLDTPGLFGDVDPAETPLIDTLKAYMSALPSAGQVYIPLGVGNHVDHQLTRQAAEQVFGEALFYEEYPYVAAPGALEKVLPPAVRDAWEPVVVPLSEPAMVAKIAAIIAYDSQISSFFLDNDDLERRVRAISQRLWAEAGRPPHPVDVPVAGAERYWRKRE